MGHHDRFVSAVGHRQKVADREPADAVVGAGGEVVQEEADDLVVEGEAALVDRDTDGV